MESEEQRSLSLETGGGERKEELSKSQGSEGPSVVSWRHRRKGWWKCLGDNGVQG